MNVIHILCDTLRRDHCGPYNKGRPLNQCGSPQQPEWVVPTPNIDRIAEHGVVFNQAYCGSTPCIPARRDIYTGRHDFLERGWAPLEEEDLDLPRQISGPPTGALETKVKQGYPISYLISDHFHLWEQGAGNYHMGYSGFDLIRGHESDAWSTDPVDFACPPADRVRKIERHFRNIHGRRKSDEDWFCAQVFNRAADWLAANHPYRTEGNGFYLHIDCFDPHEPWDAPEDFVKMFDPRGYDVPSWRSSAPYAPWRDTMDENELMHFQARYAAHVVLLDKWLGVLIDKIEELELWNDTVIIFTSDHGTFNGDHGRMGKLQTHEFDSLGHIPLIVCHPDGPKNTSREQLVQLVDLYPTILSALNREIPEHIHGHNLFPVMMKDEKIRDFAISGQFGQGVSITDGETVLHQPPADGNAPLYWYSYYHSRFFEDYRLGGYHNGRREVISYPAWERELWLSDKTKDPSELVNLADTETGKLLEMQRALKETLVRLDAPSEQLDRLGIRYV
jgi:arylsulfatase A-like enzyme